MIKEHLHFRKEVKETKETKEAKEASVKLVDISHGGLSSPCWQDIL